MYLQLLIHCMLIGLSFAVIGDSIKSARPNEFHYAVSISKRDTESPFANHHRCTGVVISMKSVLTVAHCLLNYNPSDLEIIAGNKDLKLGKKYYLQSWITYEEWKTRRKQNNYSIDDIAVITVRGEGFENVEIATIESHEHNVLTGNLIRTAGWGKRRNPRLYPDVLGTATLQIISNEECTRIGQALKDREPERPNANPFAVPPNYFCSVGPETVVSLTIGDAGGPVVRKRHTHVVIGINVGRCPALLAEQDNQCLPGDQPNSHLLLVNRYVEFIRYNQR